MRHAATEHAGHHRLDDVEREQARDRGVDRVPATREHLRAGGGGERMVGDDHAATTMRRALLAGEFGSGPCAPARLVH